VFNTFSKFTGAVGTGLSTFTFDPEYMKKREEMRSHHPKGIVDGLEQGILTAKDGFVDGISGLFTQPVKGL